MPWARLSIRYPQALDADLRKIHADEYGDHRELWHPWFRYALLHWVSMTPKERHKVITEIRKQLAEEKAQ